MNLDRKSATIGAIVASALSAVLWGAGLAGSPAAAQGTATPTPATSQVTQQIADLRTMVQATDAAAQKAQVIAVIYQLNQVGLHDLEEGLEAGKPMPAGALGSVRRARVVAAATNWPSALRSSANRVVDAMTRLETALRDENADRTKDSLHDSHENADDLSDQTYAWLGGGSSR